MRETWIYCRKCLTCAIPSILFTSVLFFISTDAVAVQLEINVARSQSQEYSTEFVFINPDRSLLHKRLEISAFWFPKDRTISTITDLEAFLKTAKGFNLLEKNKETRFHVDFSSEGMASTIRPIAFLPNGFPLAIWIRNEDYFRFELHQLSSDGRGQRLSLIEGDSASFPSLFQHINSAPKYQVNVVREERLRKAIRKIESGGTGFFISDEGHFLTALHVVAPALEASGVLSKKSVGNLDMYRKIPKPHSDIKLGKGSRQGREFSGRIMGISDANPRVVFVGSSTSIGSLSPGQTLNAEEMDWYYNMSEDFVILKYDMDPSELACLRLAEHAPKQFEFVKSYGFPSSGSTDLPPQVGHFVVGERPFLASNGKVHLTLETIRPFYPVFERHAELIAGVTQRAGITLTDVAATHGFSGGPTVRKNGTVRGVNSFVFKGGDNSGINPRDPSFLAVVDAIQIRHITEAALGPGAQSVFKCENHVVPPK